VIPGLHQCLAAVLAPRGDVVGTDELENLLHDTSEIEGIRQASALDQSQDGSPKSGRRATIFDGFGMKIC